ncbi:MAG: hypothetical protein M3P85_00295 [Actinomycetota bacterium]|nr:hypothetical protein [Actinomycetota bacterium]
MRTWSATDGATGTQRWDHAVGAVITYLDEMGSAPPSQASTIDELLGARPPIFFAFSPTTGR